MASTWSRAGVFALIGALWFRCVDAVRDIRVIAVTDVDPRRLVSAGVNVARCAATRGGQLLTLPWLLAPHTVSSSVGTASAAAYAELRFRRPSRGFRAPYLPYRSSPYNSVLRCPIWIGVRRLDAKWLLLPVR